MLAFKPHRDMSQLVFSPDGARIASASARPTVCVSDSITGKLLWKYDPEDHIGLGVAYSPDGTKLATVSWTDSITLDAATGRVLHEWRGRGYAVTFTPDGTGLFTCSDYFGFVEHTNLKTGPGERLDQLGRFNDINRLCFSPDGTKLAVLGDTAMALIAADGTGRVVRIPLTNLAAGCGALAFHPDGRTLAFSDGPKLHAFDIASNQVTATRRRSMKHVQEGAFTPDGRHFITVSNDETAVLWETDAWAEVREFAWSIGKLKTVAISPDGTRAACGSDRGRVVVWDLDT